MNKPFAAIMLSLAVALPASAEPPVVPVAVPVQAESDIAPLSDPVAQVAMFEPPVRFSFTEGERYEAFTVPAVERDRIILTVTGTPSPGEP